MRSWGRWCASCSFTSIPQYLEGDLTKIKSVVVSRQSCAKISEALGLHECLFVGKGMAANREVPPSLLADVFESLLAALYLDGGDKEARQFIELHVGRKSNWRPRAKRAGTTSRCCSSSRSASSAIRRSTSCWTRRDRTTPSASRSAPWWVGSGIRRRGAATRRKRNSGPPAMRCSNSAANRRRSRVTDGTAIEQARSLCVVWR